MLAKIKNIDKIRNFSIILPIEHHNGCSKLVHKVKAMPSGHITLTSPNEFYSYTESIGVCVAAVGRFRKSSLFLCSINAGLTMLSTRLTPSPRLTIDKYNTSQDSIDFRIVLFLSCLRAFCLAQSVSSRAFFIGPSGFVRCMLSLLLPVCPILFSGGVSLVGAVSNRDPSFCTEVSGANAIAVGWW